MFILSLYALIEVSFYASEVNIKQEEPNVPIVEIPSINLTKEVNNKSVFMGFIMSRCLLSPGMVRSSFLVIGPCMGPRFTNWIN